MRFYRAYGQCLASEIALPELPEARGTPNADIVVRERDLPRRRSALSSSARTVYERGESGFVIYETEDAFYWLCDGLGTLRVRDGRTIEFQPADGVAPARIRSLVLGPGLRSLLVQQGFLVFHASAVEIDGTAIAFVGESGAGKSTTAAAMCEHGYPFLTDDVTPIVETESDYALVPGVPTPKLTPSVAERLEYETPIETTTGSALGRRYYDASASGTEMSYRLSRIYVLSWGDELAIEPVDDVLTPLLRGSYLLYGEQDTEAFAEHFRRCASLADTVDVRALRRPRSVESIERLVPEIESDSVERTG